MRRRKAAEELKKEEVSFNHEQNYQKKEKNLVSYDFVILLCNRRRKSAMSPYKSSLQS